MPSAADILTAGGIVRGADVVAAAAKAGLDLAVAAAMLEKESGGGDNVFGNDAGTTVKGGPVTEARYKAYLADVRAGRSNRNGVGPTQLTYGPFQDRADARGGCWRWEVNLAVGFEILAGYVRECGVRDAGALYNGGKRYDQFPARHPARVYGDDLAAKTAAWRTRLVGSTTVAAVVKGAPKPTVRRGDTGPLVELIQRFLGVVKAGDEGYGTFGPATEAAVKRYQVMQGLLVDGVCGPATWAKTGL